MKWLSDRTWHDLATVFLVLFWATVIFFWLMWVING